LTLIKIALNYVLQAMSIIILVRCVLSWLPLGYNKLTEFIYTVTEPILAPIRNLLSKAMGGSIMYLDFSPIIAFALIRFLQRIIWMI